MSSTICIQQMLLGLSNQENVFDGAYGAFGGEDNFMWGFGGENWIKNATWKT